MRIPEKGRELIKRIPEPIQLEMRRLSRRSLILGFEIFAGFLVVGLIGVLLVHQRLSEGPVSLLFLVPPIENAINRELDGLTVHIDDAIVSKDPENGGVRFRLKNLRLIDQQRRVVAQAPQAAIGLSSRALLLGRIAPGRVDFIGPRLLLHYSPDAGLALAFSRPDANNDQTPASDATISGGEEPAFSKRLGETFSAAQARQIDLVQASYKALQRFRKRKTATAYLANFGVRDAVVIFDHGEKQSFWRVPRISIRLSHRKKRSTITGEADIASSHGTWSFGFRTEQLQKENRLNFTALLTDFVPKWLAADIPALALLNAIDMPVNGRIDLSLSRTGDLLDAEAKVVLSAGHIKVPWSEEGSMLVDEGVLHARYDRSEGRVQILPSTLQWGESRVTISGDMRPKKTAENKDNSWIFSLKAHDGTFAAEEFGVPAVPLDVWTAQGRILPGKGRLELGRMNLQMAGAQLEFSGSLTEGAGSPELVLDGQFSAMPVDHLKRIWPRFLAPGARDWVGRRIARGQIHGGQVRIRVPAGLLARIGEGADVPDDALAFDMPVSGVEIHFIKGLLPIVTDAARVQILGRRMAFVVPKARVVTPSGKTINVSDGRFAIDDLRPDTPQGDVVFKAQASAPAALEFLDHEPLGYVKEVGIKPSKTGGVVNADFRIAMPLLKDLKFKNLRMAGDVKLREAKFEGLFEAVKVTGGSLDFGLTEKAIDAHGELYLNGVPAKLTWQRIFAAPADKQPPLRLYGVFDSSARKQLGLQVEHMIIGDVPVEITIRPSLSGQLKVHLHADVGNGEFILTNLAWRKLPGRAAIIEFDLVKKGGATVLENFKIIGNDIGIDGWIAVDGNNQIREFYFPKFSLNLITQLEISGTRSAENVWQVAAKGETYDGRQFFRSLFSAGRLTEKELPEPQFRGDLRLHAEIGTVVGYSATTLKDVSIDIAKRAGKLITVKASGKLNGHKPVAVQLLDKPNQPRELRAHAEDAGDAFRLIGFYPSVQGGEAKLQVDLDGKGAAEKTGTLWVRDFNILGDPVVREVLANSFPDGGGPVGDEATPRRRRQPVQRQKIFFQYMQVPFAVGLGQFVFQDSIIKGPALGATMRGQVDFASKNIDLSGTYSPLYGLNSVPGQLPIIGPLLGGSRDEGLIGITFAVQGKMESPQVLVNPVSIVAPGFLRQLLFDSGRSPPKISPRSEKEPVGNRRATANRDR